MVLEQIWLDARVEDALTRHVVDDERGRGQDAELGGEVDARERADVGCGVVAGERLVEVDLVVEQELRGQGRCTAARRTSSPLAKRGGSSSSS